LTPSKIHLVKELFFPQFVCSEWTSIIPHNSADSLCKRPHQCFLWCRKTFLYYFNWNSLFKLFKSIAVTPC